MTRVDLAKTTTTQASAAPDSDATDQRMRRWMQSVDGRLRRMDDILAAPQPTTTSSAAERSPWPWLAIMTVWLAAGTAVTTAIIVFGRPGNVYVGWTGVLSLGGASAATLLILYALYLGV